VLFVCQGNVCRSPFAELLGRHLFPGPHLELASAGLGALVGAPVDQDMARELDLRGAPSEPFAGRMLTVPMVRAADLVLTMNRRQRDSVVGESPDLVWRVFVLGQLARIMADLPPGLRGDDLFTALREAHVRPAAQDEVPDPRRRGRAVAAEAARLLEAHLTSVLSYLTTP
jgi:protein-tyrosine-phosphatase